MQEMKARVNIDSTTVNTVEQGLFPALLDLW